MSKPKATLKLKIVGFFFSLTYVHHLYVSFFLRFRLSSFILVFFFFTWGIFSIIGMLLMFYRKEFNWIIKNIMFLICMACLIDTANISVDSIPSILRTLHVIKFDKILVFFVVRFCLPSFPSMKYVNYF